MKDFLVYLFQANIVLSVLCIGYWLICRQTTFFKLRRLTINFIWLASLLVPLVHMNAPYKIDVEAIELTRESPMRNVSLPSSEQLRHALDKIEIDDFQLYNNAGVIYITIFALLIVRLLKQFVSIMRVRRQSKKIKYKDGTHIFLLMGSDASFSFFRWIFIYADAIQGGLADDIISHEKIHARQWHSVDVCLGQIFTVVYWLNPFSYLLMAELRRNLEHLADQGTLISGIDRKTYQMNLLKLTYRVYPAQIYNSFNYSHLKERIVMMNKKPTHLSFCLVYLFIPALAVAFPLSGVFGKGESVDSSIRVKPMVELKELKPTGAFQKGAIKSSSLKEQQDEAVVPFVVEKTLETESLPQKQEEPKPVVAQGHSSMKEVKNEDQMRSAESLEGAWIIQSDNDPQTINYKLLKKDGRYINLRSLDGGNTYQITRQGKYEILGDGSYVEVMKQYYGSSANGETLFRYQIRDGNLHLSFRLSGQNVSEVWRRVDTPIE